MAEVLQIAACECIKFRMVAYDSRPYKSDARPLFERGLDPDKRSQLGAHYTDRDKIELLIEAVVRQPLLLEWAQAKTVIIEACIRKAAAKNTRAKNKADADARAIYQRFLDRVRSFRVLDPACGSGNFLYLSLLALKDLELLASIEAEALGLPREFSQVGLT